MKKFLMFLFVGITAMMAWSCSDDDDKDTPMSYEQLPKAAKEFVTQFYPSDKVVSVVRDGQNEFAQYEVKFASKSEVEFDAAGNWVDVNAPNGLPIPAGIAPTAIQNYVTDYFPVYEINEISRERYGYEVELTNGLDLKFDQDGIFIGHLD